MALTAQNNNNTNRNTQDRDYPEADSHMARLVGLTDLGHQEGFEYKGKEIIAIRGDKNDPFSHGHICPKATNSRLDRGKQSN